MVNFQIHQIQDFGYDHFKLSSANNSLQWHVIQCMVYLLSFFSSCQFWIVPPLMPARQCYAW